MGGERPTGDGADGGTRPTDMPTDMPMDLPDDADQPDGGAMPGGFGSFTTGLVTAVDGATVTVESTTQDGTASTSTVSLTDTTTYTTTADAGTSAIAVGLCAQVTGEADASGTVAATSVALTEATAEGCSTRGGGGFGGGPHAHGLPAPSQPAPPPDHHLLLDRGRGGPRRRRGDHGQRPQHRPVPDGRGR